MENGNGNGNGNNGRFRVCTPIERDGKTYWQRLGTAFTNKGRDGGESVSVYLDGLPLGGKLVLFHDDGTGPERPAPVPVVERPAAPSGPRTRR